MEKIIIFGAGGTGRRVAGLLKDKYRIIAFVDNDSTRWGQKLEGISIEAPGRLMEPDYDYVVLGTLMGYEELKIQLNDMKVPLWKVKTDYVELSVNSRILFLKRYSEMVYREGISGMVAEAGVFRGEFAREINRYFPDRTCYLFDTFEGFSENDIAYEQEESLTTAEYMKGLSEELVYQKMTYKEQVKICKGYFPDRAVAEKIEGQFCFVNLDMDLYKPIYEGLVYFYPRMADGGVILIHDYFSDAYPNVKKAVEDYEKKHHLRLARMPIGDDISLAVIKLGGGQN